MQILKGREALDKPGSVEENTVRHIIQTHLEKFGKDLSQGEAVVRLSCRAKIVKDIKLVITPLE